jgi:hypothetical protein
MSGPAVGYTLQFLLALVVAWGLVPRALFNPGPGPLSLRMARLVMAGIALWMGLALGLAAARSLELVTIVAALAGLALALRSRRPSRTDSGSDIGRLFDAFDPTGPNTLPRQLSRLVRNLGKHGRRLLSRLLYPPNLAALLIVFWALGAALLYPLWHASPAEARGYSYLLAVKTLFVNGGLYQGGLYPSGLFAVMAAIATVFFQDPLNVLRFWPVLTLGLGLLFTGALARELAGQRVALALAVALAALTSLGSWGWPDWSLQSPLELRFAAALVPGGLLFAVRYGRYGRGLDRLLAGAAAFAASAAEPWAGAALLVASLSLLADRRHSRWQGQAVVTELAGGALGLLPLLAGWVRHIPLTPLLWGYPLEPGPISPTLGRWGAGLILATLAAATARRWRLRAGSGVPLFAGLCLLLALSPPAALVVLGGGLMALSFTAYLPAWALSGVLGWREYRGAGWAAAAGLFGVAFWLAPATPLPPIINQPPDTGVEYLRIASHFPAYQWTIVSPALQYSEVLGRGWHFELSTFVQQYTLEEAGNPHFRLSRDAAHPIPTPNVFLFLEPWPEGLGRPVDAADLRAPLTATPSYSGEDLAAIEARGLAWAKAYLGAHPRTAHVYFRSPQLVVIWIQQPGP